MPTSKRNNEGAALAYNPKAKMDIEVSEVPFRTTAKGRALMARIYAPKGAGPFPTVLDLHGGAWTRKDRFANEPMDRAVAASGVLVVAIDMTLAGEAPYPSNVQDASYGVRWLKSKAREWRGDPAGVGLIGQLERRAYRRAHRHAAAPSAVQQDPSRRVRRYRGVRGHALAHLEPVHALAAGREAE